MTLRTTWFPTRPMALLPALRKLVLGVVIAALVTGCGSTVEAANEVGARAGAEPVIPMGEQVGDPTRVRIPKLGIDEPLVALGLTSEGATEVPPSDKPQEVGWFQPGPEPGEAGAAVILGHINGRVNGVSTPGVFARLGQLGLGDEVWVDDRRFVVTAAEQVKKESFPTDRVYGVDTPDAELRLITCGGPFDLATGHYTDNFIVSARAG
jgi:hypothetical protein